MVNHNSTIPRRKLMQGLGGAAIVLASTPLLMGAGGKPPCSKILVDAEPEDVDMSPARLEDVFARIARRVNDGLFPGATALVARHGAIVGHHAFGTKVKGEDEPMTTDTMFDLLSMTKVVATATVALVLVSEGTLDLDDKVADYLPEFATNGKSLITIRQMLTYAAGLPVDNQFLNNPDNSAVWQLMAETPTEYPPGTSVLYSDLAYRLLGRLLEVASGMDLNTLAHDKVWQPLGMHDTMYNPPASLISRIAATGYSPLRGCMVRGETQDDQDFALGGITGCDGVFSTTQDLAIFCQMILNEGTYGCASILPPSWIKKMVKNQTPQVTEADTDLSPITNLLLTPKGYGWELCTHRFSNGGMRLSQGSCGKAGGAGTFMWIDRKRDLFAIILTNHGLPNPFDEPGWNKMLDAIGTVEFFDGVINSITDD